MPLTAVSGSVNTAMHPQACFPFPDGLFSAMQNTHPEEAEPHSGGNPCDFSHPHRHYFSHLIPFLLVLSQNTLWAFRVFGTFTNWDDMWGVIKRL